MKAPSFLVSLFESHQSDLRRLIAHKFKKTHHDAEDIIQDAFHNILHIENPEAIENPKAYLYQTAANLALNRIRKQQHHHRYIAAQDQEASYDLCPERSVSARKDLERLEQALTSLPEKYQRTFLLSRVQEKSYREISELLNIPESTVEKHIIKVLKYLREVLMEKQS
ncbi:MAG: hypothetical protein B0W54_06915 [Cellvibrio sp. 79]|nr:MAG: hypothetical protein B0W54_06915 [Cellvibrio sp. 79]